MYRGTKNCEVIIWHSDGSLNQWDHSITGVFAFAVLYVAPFALCVLVTINLNVSMHGISSHKGQRPLLRVNSGDFRISAKEIVNQCDIEM